jgi:hypothetical protein
LNLTDMAKKSARKASRKLSRSPRKAARRVAAAVPRKVARRTRRTYRIGAVSSRRKTINGMKGTGMMKRATSAVMVGGGIIGGQYLNVALANTITNPMLRAGALFIGGVVLGGVSPGLAAIGAGVAGAGIANLGAQLLPNMLPGNGNGNTIPPAQQRTLTGRVGALTSAEKRMIEQAARGGGSMNGTPQSEVLTGLYDTANVLA